MPLFCVLLIHSKDNYSFCETAFFGSLAIRIPQTGIGEQQRDRGDRESKRETQRIPFSIESNTADLSTDLFC